MISGQAEVFVQADFRLVQKRVAEQCKQLAAKLTFGESYATADGQVAILAGVSRPVKGINLGQFLLEGSKWSMFMVRLREEAGKVAVLAIVGGAEGQMGLDFGRNRRLAEFLVDGLENVHSDA